MVSPWAFLETGRSLLTKAELVSPKYWKCFPWNECKPSIYLFPIIPSHPEHNPLHYLKAVWSQLAFLSNPLGQILQLLSTPQVYKGSTIGHLHLISPSYPAVVHIMWLPDAHLILFTFLWACSKVVLWHLVWHPTSVGCQFSYLLFQELCIRGTCA